LRGHFFAKPMHKNVDINGVTLVEYAECRSVADMYLYEIYYINKLKPPINSDDRARDELTVTLPELEWKPHKCHLMSKWKKEIAARDEYRCRTNRERIAQELKNIELLRTLRQQFRDSVISEDMYYKMKEEIEGNY
jgi:hypothetical protein